MIARGIGAVVGSVLGGAVGSVLSGGLGRVVRSVMGSVGGMPGGVTPGRGGWTVVALAAALSLLACQAPLQVAGPPGSAATECSALAGQPFEGIAIDRAAAITDRPDLPAFCSIEGTIEPDIGFAARFPLEGWNGKYYQAGCGGYCGSVLPDKPGFSNTINEALKRGYAAITTDAGHRGGSGDASWAEGNPVAVEMYADQAIPLTHAAGTRMVEVFYGQAPRLEYFSGCSNGGRMAAMAAQRHPTLFDGILAGGSLLDLSRNGGLHGSWVVQSNTAADGRRILTRQSFADRIPLLEQAVLAQCDGTDGVIDGIIGNPRNCTVDVAALPRCEQAGADCFTPEELQVLRQWYAGAQDAAGQRLYPGMPPGSERYWTLWFLDPVEGTAPGNALGSGYTRYLGFAEGALAGYTVLDFDFERDPPRLQEAGRRLNALDPDLDAFRSAGGKLLMWHGWQDPLVLPDQSVAYYRQVTERLGGHAATDPFFRLFMIPGHGHCWELPAALPDQFNPIVLLEDWVERGIAPAAVRVAAQEPEAPVAAGLICPYPDPPVYAATPGDASAATCPARP